jgi:hypothetical protein
MTLPAPGGKTNRGTIAQSTGQFASVSPASQIPFLQTEAVGAVGTTAAGISVGMVGVDGVIIGSVQFCVSVIVSFVQKYERRMHVCCCVPFTQSDQSVQL